MDFRKLKIKYFINFLNVHEKEKWVKILNEYFNYRVSNRIICDKEELDDLIFLVYEIKNMKIYYDKKQKNLIMTEIARLIVLSKDIDIYKKFYIFSKKKVFEFSNEEIIEYIDIILKNCYCCFVVSKFDIYIRKYFELDGSLCEILKLIDNNCFVFSKKELKYINNFIYDNYMDVVLKNIFLELENKIISGVKLCELFSKIEDFKIEKMSVNNLKLLKKIIDKFCDEKIKLKLDCNDDLESIIKMRDNIFNNIYNCEDTDVKTKNDIIFENVDLFANFSIDVINSIQLVNYSLPTSNNNRIITIDDPNSPDLDGAFSVIKDNDGYILNVYISDVPTFLRDNRILCNEAFLRGCTMYVRDYKNRCNINIDMLPECLSHHYLSLNLEGYKNVITFSFFIDCNGIVNLNKIFRERIIINNKLSPIIAKEIISTNDDYGVLQNDLRNYKELCKLVCSKSINKFLRSLNYNNISDLVGFSSVLVNYYIGYNSLFSIYRESGVYSKVKQSGYTHSVTPLRRFVSNINLAFLLEQHKIVSFSDKDLYFVQDNIDEIINHLNERDKLSKFVEKNSTLVKRYIK